MYKALFASEFQWLSGKYSGIAVVLSVLLFWACGEEDHRATILARTESKSYTGDILYTIYEHDRQGRIEKIVRQWDGEEPVVVATVSYKENDVILESSPDYDPSYDQTTKVLLTRDESGRTLKRIEQTHKTPKAGGFTTSQSLINDTLIFEYDASGFLIRRTGTRYDSSWIDETWNSVVRTTTITTYTVESGNVVAFDESVSYPRITRDGGTVTFGGGSSQYHFIYKYSNAYANMVDFRNAAILNEYKEYFELPLNEANANLPDEIITSVVDKDLDGTIIFHYESSIEMTRSYNRNGMLSAVNIPERTQYREVNYFYR